MEAHVKDKNTARRVGFLRLRQTRKCEADRAFLLRATPATSNMQQSILPSSSSIQRWSAWRRKKGTISPSYLNEMASPAK